MNNFRSRFLRIGLLACGLILPAYQLHAARSGKTDINPLGEPIPGDPLLAYVQRLQCVESIGPVYSKKTNFNWQKDTLSFPNDTFYTKGRDESGEIKDEPNGYPPIYFHRCFVLTRAVMQFHQFARFDPSLPKVSDAEYKSLVRHICRIPTWWPALSEKEKIVIPGYRDLRDFSSSRQYLVQKNIGWWWITYFRVGNWRMVMPSPEFNRPVAVKKITERVDRGDLQAVYISVFGQMNHCVVVYDYERLKNGNVVFWLYDPNYHNTSSWLVYDASANDFLFQKRWFFPGGHVKLMRAYISPLH